MENPEEVLQILERFTKLKQKEIPKELDEYLSYIARTGDTVFTWTNIKYLIREKLISVIKDFHDSTPNIDDLPQYPNVDPFNYETMKTALLERLELFSSAPFTVQRICELMTNPRKQYNRIDKFMRALEKNILVVSTVEPGRKPAESENGDSLDSVVISLDVNVDIEMENENVFNSETQKNQVVSSDISSPNSNKSDAENNKTHDDVEFPSAKKAKLDLEEENHNDESVNKDDDNSKNLEENNKHDIEENNKNDVEENDTNDIEENNTKENGDHKHEDPKEDEKDENVEDMTEKEEIKEKEHKQEDPKEQEKALEENEANDKLEKENEAENKTEDKEEKENIKETTEETSINSNDSDSPNIESESTETKNTEIKNSPIKKPDETNETNSVEDKNVIESSDEKDSLNSETKDINVEKENETEIKSDEKESSEKPCDEVEIEKTTQDEKTDSTPEVVEKEETKDETPEAEPIEENKIIEESEKKDIEPENEVLEVEPIKSDLIESSDILTKSIPENNGPEKVEDAGQEPMDDQNVEQVGIENESTMATEPPVCEEMKTIDGTEMATDDISTSKDEKEVGMDVDDANQTEAMDQ